MADQDLTHTADIIKAALPFVDSPLKGPAELFAKFLDLMGSFRSATQPGKLAASGFRLTNIDFEGLLKGIRPICNAKEQEMVDRFLNFFNMKRTFEMYNNMMSMMKNMQDVGDFSFADAFGAGDADNVTGNFNGSAFESIFKNFSNFGNDPSENSSDNPFPDIDTEHFKAAEATDSDNNSFNSSSSNNDTTGSSHSDEQQSNDTTGSSNSSGGMNNNMFEMLKSMIPPEQMSSFQNLSMLFNAMSYDNNSKSDDDKE